MLEHKPDNEQSERHILTSIAQLEQTVTKLQTELGYTPEQIGALPPHTVKIRELEADLLRAREENEELSRLLAESRVSTAVTRRDPLTTYPDGRCCDRDYKRCKMVGHAVEGVYISPSETPAHMTEPLSRPPPLTIPQAALNHYSNIPSNANHHGPGLSLSFILHAPAFQMPNTPSGSSATSSPPFSPVQMQAPIHPPMDQHPQQHNYTLSNYAQHHPNQCPGISVKVEDNPSYTPGNHHSSLQYSYSHGHPHDHTMDWNTYLDGHNYTDSVFCFV
ncbi:uncharacterized protein LACBIDRAFT_313519 [Laccaria bicolor S238N-H82]|uniref:Predicted protein n=1 Tax=Laccaria bicolor (strain S238N-H82 / ATCC MYA-4686) TaxID=486041 RepID=B0D063_LACBS|nr:uncharacterized protein LACBIDRAFT_313514 [Laccaria bicolor S238N-H82]XP_001877672.1 uncharacterized protein LACBIDRAFT_313519 [Laccaria bicolor S238N-H82]EDR11774.1 predicted protein [Laccaria bicolor S238N-H82]EDR11775.1 predicted protein [Laccaria bicolor S238N-H82]|eukprot:XP_001877671.1 predicted protein [Laccaria bicolor S238N-H82]